jgi:hypothetical protein
MDLSEFQAGTCSRENALVRVLKAKHMMGPFKACVADTPRLAAVRTTEAAFFARARSQHTSKAHPLIGTPHPLQPRRTASRVLSRRGDPRLRA